MPLPEPLRKGASKKKQKAQGQKVMHELKHSPVTSPARKATHGVQRHKQDVAIMLKNIGKDKAEPAKSKTIPEPPMNKRRKKSKPV